MPSPFGRPSPSTRTTSSASRMATPATSRGRAGSCRTARPPPDATLWGRLAPELDASRALARIEGRLRGARGPTLDAAVAQVEAAAVARALDRVAVQRAAAQRAAAVRAAVVNGHDRAVDANEQNRGVADDDRGGLAVHLGGGRCVGPVLRAGVEHGLIDAHTSAEAQVTAEVARHAEQPTRGERERHAAGPSAPPPGGQ